MRVFDPHDVSDSHALKFGYARPRLPSLKQARAIHSRIVLKTFIRVVMDGQAGVERAEKRTGLESTTDPSLLRMVYGQFR